MMRELHRSDPDLPPVVPPWSRSFVHRRAAAHSPQPTIPQWSTLPRSCAARWDALLVALALMLYTQVWRIQDIFPVLGGWGLPLAATLVALLVWGLDRDPRRRAGLLNHRVVWAALGILVLVVLSIPGGLYPGYSLNFLLKDYLRSIALMLVVAVSVRGLPDLRRLAWLQVVGVTLFSAVLVARSQMGADGRLRDLEYYDVNDLATLIVSTLPLVLYLWRPGRIWVRPLLAAATALLLMTLVKTGSRSGFVGLLTVAGYLLLRFHRMSRVKRVGTAALLATMLVTVASDRYVDRMQSLLHLSTDYNWSGQSESGRIEVWKRGIGYMLSHPVLGVGARTFFVAEGTLAREAAVQEYGRGFKWSEAHNAFIQIGAELGVLGLTLFIALLVGAFRALSRARRGTSGEAAFLAQTLTACLVGFVVTSFFLSQAYSAYLYTLLGMSVGLARIASPARGALLTSLASDGQ